MLTETPDGGFLSLGWKFPLRNILLVKKRKDPRAADALLQFAT